MMGPGSLEVLALVPYPLRDICGEGEVAGKGCHMLRELHLLIVLSVLVMKADLFCHPLVMADEGNGRGILTATWEHSIYPADAGTTK